MLHRAIVGSLERFIGILIEHHAGALPAWLAPVQVGGRSTSRKPGRLRRTRWRKRCKNKGLGLKPICATRKSPIKSASIRLQKVPYILVVGDKEKASGTVAVRARGNQDLGVMSLDEFSREGRTTTSRSKA